MARPFENSRVKDGWRYEPKVSGKRFKFRFVCKKSQLVQIQAKLDELIRCWALGEAPGVDLYRWIQTHAKSKTALYRSMVNNGLVEERKGHTLGSLCDAFLALKKKQLAEGSIGPINQAIRALKNYFGNDRDITTITNGQAKEFRVDLETEPRIWRKNEDTGKREKVPYAHNTVANRLKKVSSIFEYAVDHEYITRNPFKGVTFTEKVNTSRQHFIAPEVMAEIFEALPDARWRLLFALYRIGGVRFKEAAQLLKWEHILWDKDQIDLPDAKAAIRNQLTRRIPIFNELRPYLDDVWELAQPGDVYVFPEWANMKHPNQYLSKMFKQYLKRAGIKVWPKFFMNMRSSRVTELIEQASPITLQRAFGHNAKIQAEHYVQHRDSDLDKLREISSKQTAEVNRQLEEARQRRSALPQHNDGRTKARTDKHGTETGQRGDKAGQPKKVGPSVPDCPSTVTAGLGTSCPFGTRTRSTSLPRTDAAKTPTDRASSFVLSSSRRSTMKK